MTVAPDRSLLDDLAKDPDAGLAAIVERFETGLVRHAAAVLNDADRARDVVQESFLRLLSARDEIEALPSWLHRVTHNLALDVLRKEKRMHELHAAAAVESPRVAERADRALERREAESLLLRGLARLTPNQRAVVYLKVKEELSYQEIAARTGLSPSNVGYLLHHGLKALAHNLRAARAEA